MNIKEIKSMENITKTLVTTAIFDEKRTHRYLLTKTWDDSKKTATVITMYPNYDGIINIDLTTQLNYQSTITTRYWYSALR